MRRKGETPLAASGFLSVAAARFRYFNAGGRLHSSHQLVSPLNVFARHIETSWYSANQNYQSSLYPFSPDSLCIPTASILMFSHSKIDQPQVRFKELEEILEQMPVGVAIAEVPSGKLLFHNREAVRLLRHPMHPASDFTGYTRYGATHPDGTPYAANEYPIARAIQGESVSPEEMIYIRGDGTETCLLVNAAPVKDGKGVIVKAVSTFYDISEQKHSREALALSERRLIEVLRGGDIILAERKQAELLLQETATKLRLAVEIAQLGFWEWNIETDEVYFSPQWKRQLGYQDHEVPHRIEEWESRIHPADRARVMVQLHAYLRAPTSDYEGELRFKHRDGSYRWIQARAQVVRDDQGHALRMIGTHIDISEHKEREEQVRLFAQHDRLTRLPNRALTLESAERWLSAAQRTGNLLAVLYMDLDEFKPINDTYGHHIGDEVLKEVALRLKGSFRSHDIVGRLGGDEFLVIVTQLDNALSAAHAAVHALHELSLPYRIGDLVLHTSPSIGISMFPDDGTNIETLVRNADCAMYEAKQSGKGAYRFFTKRHLAESFNLEASLRHSLASDALQLHFQPIVDTHSGRLIAAEALLRWPTPHGRQISPEVFIPIAEQNGFMSKLGDWVLQKACAQHRQWQQEGLPPIHMGINLSAMQFREADLIGSLSRSMDEYRVDPQFLSVEISDRVFTGNFQYAAPVLEKLKARGIRITLDDFGAGYSSLEKLSRLPFDRVKIDRSLIMSLPDNKVSIAVTAAAISFGNSLDIEVVAEGLESERVLDFLEEHDCYRAQGFYLAKPMPGAEFARWYRRAGCTKVR
jgi:diguanylate cyclase (GGDEF)-like protein/PAS domain S-box-containing protein